MSFSPQELSGEDNEVIACTFQGHFIKAKLSLRFPCMFFIEWKQINGKLLIQSQNRYKIKNDVVEFNETLVFTTEMIKSKVTNQFLKKESVLKVNLVSASRPDQAKLVGQLTLDLAEVANSLSLEVEGSKKLTYCSIDAELMFAVKLIDQNASDKKISDLQRSAFCSDHFGGHNLSRASINSRSKSKEVKELVKRVSHTSPENAKLPADPADTSSKPRNEGLQALSKKDSNFSNNNYITIEDDGATQKSYAVNVNSPEKDLSAEGQQQTKRQKGSSQILENMANGLLEKGKQHTQQVQKVYQEENFVPRTVGHRNIPESRDFSVAKKKQSDNDIRSSELSMENKELKQQLETHYQKIGELEEKIKALILDLEREKIRKKEETEDLQNSKLQQVQSQLSLLKKKLEGLNSQNQSKQQEIEEKQGLIRFLEASLAEKDREVSEFQESLSGKNLMLERCEAVLGECEAEKQQLLRSNAEKEQRIIEQGKQLVNLHETIQKTEEAQNSELLSITQKVTDLEEELKGRDLLISEYEKQIEQIISEKNEQKKSRQIQEDKLKKQNQELMIRFEEMKERQALIGKQEQSSQNQLKNELNTVNEENFMLQSTVAELKHKIEQLQNSISHTEANHQSENEKAINLEGYRKEVSDLEIQLSERDLMIKGLQKEIAGHNEELQSQTKLREDYESLKGSNQQLKLDYEQTVKRYEQKITLLHDEFKKFTQEVEAFKSNQELSVSENTENNGPSQMLKNNTIEEINASQEVSQGWENDQQPSGSGNIEIVKGIPHETSCPQQRAQNTMDLPSVQEGDVSEKQALTTKISELQAEIQSLKKELLSVTQENHVYRSRYEHENGDFCVGNQYKHQENAQNFEEGQFLDNNPNAFVERKPQNGEQEPNEQQQHQPLDSEQVSVSQPVATHDNHNMSSAEERPSESFTRSVSQNFEPSASNQLGIKITVNEVASVDESHHSKDHQVVITEEDYLPYKRKARVSKSPSVHSNEIMGECNKVEVGEKAESEHGFKNNGDQQELGNCGNRKKTDEHNRSHHELEDAMNLVENLSEAKELIRQSSISLNQRYEEKVIEMTGLEVQLLDRNQEVKRLSALLQEKIAEIEEYQTKIVPHLQGLISEQQDDSRMKDQVLMDMEEKIQENYNLKFELSEVLDQKREIEELLTGRQRRVGELEEMVYDLERRMVDMVPRQNYFSDQAKEQQKSFSVQRESQSEEKLSLIESQKHLEEVSNENALLSEDILLMREELHNSQREVLSYREAVLALEKTVAELKEDNERLTSEANRYMEKFLVAEEDSEVREQQLEFLEHSGQHRERKKSISILRGASVELRSLEEIKEDDEQKGLGESVRGFKEFGLQSGTLDDGKAQQKVGTETQPQVIYEETQGFTLEEQKDKINNFEIEGSPNNLEQGMNTIGKNPENGTAVRNQEETNKLIQDLRCELQILREELMSETRELEGLRKDFTEKEDQSQRVQEQNQDLKLKVKEMKKDLDDYIATYQDQINQWIIEKEEGYSSFSGGKKKSTAEANSEMVERLEKEKIQLEKENAGLKSHIKALQEKELQLELKQEDRALRVQELQFELSQTKRLATEQSQSADFREPNEASSNSAKLEETTNKLHDLEREYHQIEAELESEKTKKQQQLKHLQQETNTKIEGFQSLVSELNGQICLLQSQKQQLRTQYGNMQRALNQKEAEVQSLAKRKEGENIEQRNKHIERIEELQKEAASKYKNIAELVSESTALKEGLAAKERELTQNQQRKVQQKDQLEEKFNEIQFSNNVLKEEIEILSQEKLSLASKIEQLLHRLQNQQQSQKQQVSFIEKQIQIYRSEAEALGSDKAKEEKKFKEVIAALNSEIEDQRIYIDELEKLRQDKSQEAIGAEALIKQSSDEIRQLKESVRKREIQISDYEQTSEQIKHNLRNHENSIRQKDCIITNLQASLYERQLELEKAKVEISNKQGTVKDAQERINSLQEAIGQMEKEMKIQKSSHEQSRKQSASKQNVIVEMTSNIEQLYDQVADLQSIVSYHLSKEKVMKEHLELLEEESNRIFEIIKEKEIDEEQWDLCVKDLQAKLEVKDEELLRLSQEVQNLTNMNKYYEAQQSVKAAKQSMGRQTSTYRSSGGNSAANGRGSPDTDRTIVKGSFMDRNENPSQKALLSERDNQKHHQDPSLEEQQQSLKQSLIATNENLLKKNREYLEALSARSNVLVENEVLRRELSAVQNELRECKEKFEGKQHPEKNPTSAPSGPTPVIKSASLKSREIELESQNRRLKKALDDLKLVGKGAASSSAVNGNVKHHSNPVTVDSQRASIVKPLQDLLKEKEQIIAQLKEQVIKGESVIAKLRAQNRTFEQSSKELKDQVRENELSILQLKSKISQLESGINQNSRKAVTFELAKEPNSDVSGSPYLKAKEKNEQSLEYSFSTPQRNHETPNQVKNDFIVQKNIQGFSAYQNGTEVVGILQRLLQSLDKRNSGIEQQHVLKQLIEKNLQLESELSLPTNTKNLLLEKSLSISRQLQRIKVMVVKSPSKSVTEKQELIRSFKPCESYVSQLQDCIKNIVVSEEIEPECRL